ncbi:MAG: hypothetical protein O2820_01995 [Planctomycetota bacterium]|nr:hypothetical protein [Planctomycetota bacterium]MDA1247970.1 hypothetical protein [Planctomycetota bacterium]
MGRWELIDISEKPWVPEEAKAAMSDRVSWQCPECGRSFRIPASKPRPAWCPECAAAMETGEDDIDFDVPAPARKPKFNPSVTVKKANDPRPSEPAKKSSKKTGDPSRGTPVPSPFGSSSSAVPLSAIADDDHDAKQQQILDELAKISQTMKFFRRLVWGMAIAMILNVVLMGVGMVYSMSMLGSVGSLLQPAAGGEGGNLGGANVDPNKINMEGLPPKLQNDLKAIQEYNRTVNELLQEGQ